ncbi:MAG TPA: 3,4-dehydroadipyl-CoA semialdehyde dehydrogenase [Polyangiaceae bacterium]|nr:3,4-dehydroadipyl-CoA semialdehyde dehydrogenase [Polyangiaceae bacterium]
MELQSYLEGKWQRGKGNGVTLVNPATEQPLGTATADGIDFSPALAHARSEGGSALAQLTFAQRGEMLRSIAKAVHAHRDELLALAMANGGNTRSDAKFDIDGAIGTLTAYADWGTELGGGLLLADGDATQLGRSARLFGQHVFVSKPGVAVHINAFNFPAWGLGEKAAAALLAGMPVISKPATSTALVAYRIAQIIVDGKLTPPGVFSFIAGSTGNLLDRLTGHDVLAFTGSSGTGSALRATPSIISANSRVNVEADSLNAAVLGPDVENGSEVMNLFLNDVVRDMTQKTGQKCTAIRRVYVPKAKTATVIEQLRERLGAVRVGDPTREEVTMGPVATAQQLRDVRDGIGKLSSVAKIVTGGRDAVAGIGAPSGKGFFLAPTLLFAESPAKGDAVHELEVFGPVATVMPYDGTASQVATLVAAGGGGLVTSVYSDDKSFLRSAIAGIAPFHGRVVIGSAKVAGQTIPPGTVLPSLIHGGPGRAGGGEELGGRRGLAFYMQRVALQGDRALIDGLLKP